MNKKDCDSRSLSRASDDISCFVLHLLSVSNDLQTFLAEIYKKYEMPVIVTDIAFNYVAYGGPLPCVDPLWDIIIETGSAAPETVINQYFGEGYTDKMASSESPIDATWGPTEAYPQTTCSVRLRGSLVGCCSVLYFEKANLDFALRLNGALAEAAAIFLSGKSSKSCAHYNPESATIARFLLESVSTPISLIYGTDFYQQERFDFNYMVCVISSKKPNPGRLQNVVNCIREKHRNMVFLNKGEDNFLFFWNIKSERQRVQLIEDIYEESQKKIPIVCGVSRLFNDPEKRGAYIEQAKLAADYGKQYGDPDNTIFYYFDCYCDILLILGFNNISPENLILPEIETLITYDQKNGTNFYSTLECYLEEFCDLGTTAARLFLHRNSLLYRLKKCEEIMNVDLKDNESRNRLSLCCRLVRLRASEADL